jgi:hypothetical protein
MGRLRQPPLTAAAVAQPATAHRSGNVCLNAAQGDLAPQAGEAAQDRRAAQAVPAQGGGGAKGADAPAAYL